VLGRALARGASLDEAVAEARLRVEAIPLIPRIVAFAKERKVVAVSFEALIDMMSGVTPRAIVEKMFAAY
jgi:glycerol-3-phosphate dehydrogenase (NAD(P)+)